MSKSFSLSERLRSFEYAFKGLKTMFRTEHNARLHLFFAALCLILCLVLKPSQLEMIGIVFSIGLVFITELINTALEKLANFVEPERNPEIGAIKDLAAAAVLVAALVALSIGALVFLPKLAALLN